jgi:hypothetical protein
MLFFAALVDVVSEADNPGSVTNTFSERVKAEIGNRNNFALHNDSSHGDHFEGCGFLAKQDQVYVTANDKFDDLIKRNEQTRPKPYTEAELSRMKQLAAAAKSLASRDGYFDMSGGELVRTAVEDWGAVLLTYAGDHTASRHRINFTTGETYKSADANHPDTDYETSFNADAHHAAEVAREHMVDSSDAELFVELISTATVDVLGPIEEIHYA